MTAHRPLCIAAFALALWGSSAPDVAAAQQAADQPAERAVGSDDERPPAAPARSPFRDWYGYQTLLADLVGYGLVVLAFERDSGGLFVFGTVTLVLAAPILHAINDNTSAGGTSLAVRLIAGLAFVGGSLACALGGGLLGDDGNPAGCVAAGLGALAFPVMTLVDALGLAFRPRSGGGALVTPWLDPRRHAGGLALRAHL